MSYVTRRREITERAESASPEEIAAVWSEDPELALDLAEVANHLPTLERALTSGVVGLQLRVVSSSSLPRLDPELVKATLPDLPMDVRRRLFRRIRSKHMSALAEALLDAVPDVHEAASLLPLCSASTVERQLPALEHAVSMAAVAKRHPELVLTRAFAELAELESRDAWWQRYGHAIDKVVEYAPDRVLDLVERFGPAQRLPFSVPSATILARTDAARFIRLLEHRTCLLGRPAYVTLARANPPELVLLGRQNLVQVLHALPPSRRAEFFDAVHADRNMARVDIPEDVLRLLPKARRVAEARRMRAIAAETGDEQRVRWLTSFLPFEEAKEDLTKVTQSGEADERAAGYPLLISCAAKDFRLTELLPWLVERLKREQDPVRRTAIQALAAASPRALGEAAELPEIARDAFDARDFSGPTGEALAGVCEKLLVHNGSPMALEILAQWWNREGWYSLGRFGQRLRRGQEREVFAALRDMVTTAAENVDFDPAFALVRTFGRRAWDMPELLDLLWTAIPWGLEYASREAITLLLDDPRHRNQRVTRILDLDPTAVFLPSVMAVLQYARTDLLDVLLGSEIPEGTFAPKQVRLIPLGLTATRRWLPEQRERYAELVGTLADSETQPRDTRARAVRTLGTIHGPAKRTILRYLDSADELIAQAALAVLPDADDPDEALDLLFERALSDNRGQAELTSMYTIRRCARRVAPSHLTPKLRDALSRGGRVTVRKELVRLVSDFRLPGAVEILRQIWDVPNQHRDVRAATAFVALSWLDDPAAWELLRAAVNGPREVSMQVLRVQPYSVPNDHRAGVAALIRGVAEGPDDRLRTEAVTALGSWTHWYPEAIAVLSATVTNLEERVAWRAAANGLEQLSTTEAGEAAVIDVLRTLLELPVTSDADEDRDRPAEQRARQLIYFLTRRWNYYAQFRPPMRRVSDELLGYDQVRSAAINLRVSTIDTESPDLLADLRDIERLVADRPFMASYAGRVLTTPRNADALVAAASGLTDGHFLVAILDRHGRALGWPEPWRDLLRGLRRHTDPDVRNTALAMTTAIE